MTTFFLTLALALAAVPAANGQDHQHQETTRRGDAVMGFSHDKTRHQFRLRANGGEIEAVANDPADHESASQIRGHLRHVARMFSGGDFTAPILIHARNPPGADVMAARTRDITYTVEELPAGARIRMTTTVPEVLEAIHRFLRFQITDHRTGDPLTIQQ
jgi:hypothetical protein